MAAFSVWALAGKWFHAKSGEAGLFVACLLVFLGASGCVLHRLVRGPRSFFRFYSIFVPAFVAYAVLWCVAWFTLGFGKGEWTASLAGSIAFVAMTALRFGNYRGLAVACVVFFCLHSAGYFLGSEFMRWMKGSGGQLGWGLIYGFGFGAGMGYVFYTFQRPGN